MKALYRKYRPKSLKEVIGQEKVTSVLKNSIDSNKISHAYLFTGPRGTGKTSVARIFAHEINNFPYTLEDSYVDIIEIDAASNTGVDNIRDLRERAIIAPSKGKYKVYIIDEVHMLSKSAFNALLKILEEPPKHVVFILATTEIQKVPITITSRVQKLVFNLAEKQTMFEYLRTISEKEKINISDKALEIVVKKGGGSFRDSLSLLDQISNLAKADENIDEKTVNSALGLPEDEYINELLKAYTEKNLEKITDLLKYLLNSGLKPENLAEEIINTILENPDKILFPLLEKLPEVRAPFPEAKLLLAFSNFENTVKPALTRPNFYPNFKKTSTDFNANPEKSLADSPKNSSQNPTYPTSSPLKSTESLTKKDKKTSSNSNLNSENSSVDSEPNPKNTLAENSPKQENQGENTVGTFTVEAYKDELKTASIGLSQQLKKCDFALEKDTLKIYPPTKTIQTIISSKNNLNLLRQKLPEKYNLIIGDYTDYQKKSAKDNPKIAKINDIMGQTEEVKSGGEIPF